MSTRSNKGRRTILSFKYYTLKKMRNRAIDFRDKAKTVEEKRAWDEVVDWFNSYLKPEYRCFTKNGAIGLKIDRISDVFREQKEEEIKEENNNARRVI